MWTVVHNIHEGAPHMNFFKRICLFFFGAAGIIALLALSLPWVGPWTKLAVSMLAQEWYFIMVEAVVCITAFGLLFSLLYAIFAPRNAKTVLVSKSGSDQVTVATAAISSQATHIIEADGDYHAERVNVSARRGRVNVMARVRPVYAVNVTVEGQRLHDALVSGLSEICGDAVGRVNIEFTQPDSLDPKPDYSSVDSSYSNSYSSDYSSSYSSASYEPLPEQSSKPLDAPYEITVHMGSSSTPSGAESDTKSSGEEG